MKIARQKTTFGKDFESFLDYLRADDATTKLSPQHYVELLEIDLQMLADNAGVRRDIVLHVPDSPRLQHYLHEAVRVLRAATDLNGSVETALSWFSTARISSMDCKTPDTLVAEGRTDALLAYVLSLEAGHAG